MPKIITFKSAEDAIAVASHLYCSLVDSMILVQDNKAAELAISLAGVEVERVEGMSCPLPFPAHKRECKDSDKIRIYVQCLSAWSYGLMHGIWLDACRQVDEIRSDIDWLLSWSPVSTKEACQEWIIVDYEGFEGVRIDEHESIERVAEIAIAVKEYGLEQAMK